MSKIVFIEQFYYPEGWGGARLAIGITMYLAITGKRIEVICGGDQYIPAQRERIPDPRKVGIILRKVPRLFRGSIRRGKLLKQLLFYVGCLPMLAFRRRPQAIVSQTNPPLIVILAALAAAIHRSAFVIIAQDIYPDVLFASGMLRRTSIPGRILDRLFAWAYRRADRVVALGNLMATLLMARGVESQRVKIIPNWATGSLALDVVGCERLRESWNLVGNIVILYTGNLGIPHDVDTVLRGVQSVVFRNPGVRLVFVGGGSREAEARTLCQQLGLSDSVQFHAFVPMKDLPAVLALAHIALVTLRQGFAGLVVPSKAVGYMARGLPTIYVGPASDVEELLTESKGGLCCRNGDVATVAANITKLIEDARFRLQLGDNAAAYYQSHLRRGLSLQKYGAVIEEAIGPAKDSSARTGR